MSYEMTVQQAAIFRGWMTRFDQGQVLVEIATEGGRTQVVTVMPGQDSDGEEAIFFWSRAGDARPLQNDPWGMFQLSAQLTYGKVTWYNNETVIMHAHYGASLTVQDAIKTIWCVGHAADDIERRYYGTDTL